MRTEKPRIISFNGQPEIVVHEGGKLVVDARTDPNGTAEVTKDDHSPLQEAVLPESEPTPEVRERNLLEVENFFKHFVHLPEGITLENRSIGYRVFHEQDKTIVMFLQNRVAEINDESEITWYQDFANDENFNDTIDELSTKDDSGRIEMNRLSYDKKLFTHDQAALIDRAFDDGMEYKNPDECPFDISFALEHGQVLMHIPDTNRQITTIRLNVSKDGVKPIGVEPNEITTLIEEGFLKIDSKTNLDTIAKAQKNKITSEENKKQKENDLEVERERKNRIYSAPVDQDQDEDDVEDGDGEDNPDTPNALLENSPQPPEKENDPEPLEPGYYAYDEKNKMITFEIFGQSIAFKRAEDGKISMTKDAEDINPEIDTFYHNVGDFMLEVLEGKRKITTTGSTNSDPKTLTKTVDLGQSINSQLIYNRNDISRIYWSCVNHAFALESNNRKFNPTLKKIFTTLAMGKTLEIVQNINIPADPSELVELQLKLPESLGIKDLVEVKLSSLDTLSTQPLKQEETVISTVTSTPTPNLLQKFGQKFGWVEPPVSTTTYEIKSKSSEKPLHPSIERAIQMLVLNGLQDNNDFSKAIQGRTQEIFSLGTRGLYKGSDLLKKSTNRFKHNDVYLRDSQDIGHQPYSDNKLMDSRVFIRDGSDVGVLRRVDDVDTVTWYLEVHSDSQTYREERREAVDLATKRKFFHNVLNQVTIHNTKGIKITDPLVIQILNQAQASPVPYHDEGTMDYILKHVAEREIRVSDIDQVELWSDKSNPGYQATQETNTSFTEAEIKILAEKTKQSPDSVKTMISDNNSGIIDYFKELLR